MKPHHLPYRNRRLAVSARHVTALAYVLIALEVFSTGEMLRAQTAAASANPTSGFVPGSRELFSINFAQEPLGEFPKLLRQLSGSMEIVEKDGMRMLRASTRSEFLITLAERLPDRFTLEFDLVTRAKGYNNEELGFEGTPTPNQSGASAYISWYQGAVNIHGGRESNPGTVAMPDDIQALIEGQMAEIRVEFAGDNFKLYTNGRRLFNLPDLKFVRGRVLRVLLGGNDANQYAVHLARLRIADATSNTSAVAQQQSAMTSGSNVMTNTSTAAPLAITGLTVSVNASGAAVVTWNPLPVAATYLVVRWNANDPACCNAMSPPGIPLTSPVWQDSVLPVRGTYAYRVIAKTSSGTIEAETRYLYGGAPTPPPGVATVTPVTTVTPTTGTITPMPAPTTTTTTTSGTGTGVTGTGTILSPEPPPPTAPYSSEPRLVTTMPTTTTTTSTTPTSTESITVAPATTTGTITPISSTTTPSSGPGMPVSTAPARYRVLLTGFAVAKQTNDDPLQLDGKGDEAFAAAAVVNWDRRVNQMTSYAFVQTREYGDVAVATLFPDRIQAGSVSAKGGLAAGDRVPGNYDVTGANLPSPATDRFPLLVWEGELTAGGEALVIAPSIWERDTVRTHFNNYRTNWSAVSGATLLSSTAVTNQYGNPSLTSAVVPLSPLTAAAPPAPTFTGPVTNGYKIATLAFGPSSDRPIGMSAAVGVLVYQERVALITREKVNSLNAGDGVTIAIPYPEPIDIMLNGIYTLYLRVQRVQ